MFQFNPQLLGPACIMVAVVCVLAAVIALIVYKIAGAGGDSSSGEIAELKKQLAELKMEQLKSQHQAIVEQQKLFALSDRNMANHLKQIMDSVNQNQANITTNLRSSNAVIQDIQNKLGNLEATTQNIQEIGKDISSLQEILQAPKLRGNLGEYLLEELLKDILPAKNYSTQYSFKDGTKVDAVIKLGDGIVPVDSKFPLESFQRLVAASTDAEKKQAKREFTASCKKRIDEIADKYIKPGEGTFEFGMMYIPAENVFYEIIISDSVSGKEYEILNYAIQRHVIPVSPNTFYAYLMAIVYGLKGFKIEQEAKTIIGQLSQVQNSFASFHADFQTLGKHLNQAGSKYNELNNKAEKLNGKVEQITNAQIAFDTDTTQYLS